MAKAFVSDVTIFRSPEQVWEVLTDWDHAHEWMTGIDSITGEGELAPGMTLAFRSRGKERPAEIASVDPGRSLVIRSVQGGVTADYVYELHPSGSGHTAARLTALVRTRGPWLLLSPILRLAMKRADADQMDALKAHIGD